MNYITITDEQLDGGVDWMRKHIGTHIMDTPLWVLVSLGLQSAKVPEWIPVAERLPEEDGVYLVTTIGTNNDIIDIAYYTDDIWNKASRITAWMPLPKPYRERRGKKK